MSKRHGSIQIHQAEPEASRRGRLVSANTARAMVWNNISRLWFIHTDAGPVLADPQPAPPTLSVRL